MKIHKLAIDGGNPVRSSFLQYGKQSISENDIRSVENTLRSNFLTSGPAVEEFEGKISEYCDSEYSVSLSSGTTALHALYKSIGLEEDDEVIIPSITFASTATSVLFCGARPVFTEIDPETLLIDTKDIDRKISSRTKLIVGVDYAGQMADYEEINNIRNLHNEKIYIFADAAHSFGALQSNNKSGNVADATTFSFHPVKGITTAEGGAVSTNDLNIYKKIKKIRNHGISLDFNKRDDNLTWEYDIDELGFNYRLSDLHASLGLSQIESIGEKIDRRKKIADKYDLAIDDIEGLSSLRTIEKNKHAHHIYVVKIDLERFTVDRSIIFRALRAENIGVNVHYIPLYNLKVFSHLGYNKSNFPVTNDTYERILTLPIWPDMLESDIQSVVDALIKVLSFYRK